MLTDLIKINGCLLGGAVGDAFGAPVEGLMRLSDIRATFGPQGLYEFTSYRSMFDDAEHQGLGVITDDTTMACCTLAAMITAVECGDMVNDLAATQWHYYRLWGSYQRFGQMLNDDPVLREQKQHNHMPDYLRPFLFVCGAGRGTMAALLQDRYGTLDNPLNYRVTLGGRPVESPNRGCGAMMRMAPVSFMAPEYDIVSLARMNAAMTHGHSNAINAAAMTAVMVRNAVQYDDIQAVLQHSKNEMLTLPDNQELVAAWDMAEKAALGQPAVIETINDLGYAFKPQNPFTALPVFAQTVYTLYETAKHEPSPESFKNALRLAVNHAGDSDSVGAITGNILGAAWGVDALPQDWVDLVMCKDDILHLGQLWHDAAIQHQQYPKKIQVE